MSGLIGTILILGVAAFVIWKRCEIYPPICYNQTPFAQQSPEEQKKTTAASIEDIAHLIPFQTVKDFISTPHARPVPIHPGLDDRGAIPGAKFAKTLSQHGWRLSV